MKIINTIKNAFVSVEKYFKCPSIYYSAYLARSHTGQEPTPVWVYPGQSALP